jgi:hypothetical protein
MGVPHRERTIRRPGAGGTVLAVKKSLGSIDAEADDSFIDVVWPAVDRHDHLRSGARTDSSTLAVAALVTHR